MKKLAVVVALSLCTAPAFAKPALPRLAALKNSSSLQDLTSLPTFTKTHTLTGLGFGTATSPVTSVFALPGLGTITKTFTNGGKGGSATLVRTFTNVITPGATVLPPLKSSYTFSAVGFGKGSNPSIQPIKLGAFGTLTVNYDNTGKGGTTMFSWDYVNTAL